MTPKSAAVLEKVERAHLLICDLAAGKHKWQMCVPPQSDDSDMILQAPLDIIKSLLEANEKLRSGLRQSGEDISNAMVWTSTYSKGFVDQSVTRTNALLAADDALMDGLGK